MMGNTDSRWPASRSILILALLLLPSIAISAPQVKQFFPSRSVLLGQPLFWTIELRYPLWEFYRLQIQPCKGADITIAEDKVEEINGHIRAVYRLRVVPENLSITETPSVIITDPKGQSTVVSGKAIEVQSLTGKSLEIKDPTAVNLLPLKKPGVIRDLLLFLAVSVLTILLLWKFYYVETPRQVFLRRFKMIQDQFQTEHQVDVPLLRAMLRSDLLWGRSVQAMSGIELKQSAKENADLSQIAQTIESLEYSRYSNESVRWDWRSIKKSIEIAMTLVRSGRKKK